MRIGKLEQVATSKRSTRRGRRRRQNIKAASDLAHATEGSDAESKFEWKWFGVPHWEIQQWCTDELTDQVLVVHETPGRHHLRRCGIEIESR